MRLRQEQLVFLLTAAGVAFLVLGDSGGAVGVRGSVRPSELEIERYRPPALERALRASDGVSLDRELFSPPSDTRPLAPLAFVPPPREPFPVVVPPPEPAPEPRFWARFLQRPHVLDERPELFDEAVAEPPPLPEESAAAVEEDDEPSTAAERAARVEAAKATYDWIQIGPTQHVFGSIENPDRLGLRDPGRATEGITVREIDPETGREGITHTYERERVQAFGFADTVANRIDIRRRELGEISRADYLPALEFAAWCVRVRNEAPRALDVALELYRELERFEPDDPQPGLGVARCLEAGFRFEEALAQYERLLESFGHRAAVHVGLAELEARFLLDESAEERLRRAVGLEPASWRVNSALGRFLLDRGRPAEALVHLERAAANPPQEPARRDQRTGIRLDLAEGLVALGRVGEARSAVTQALRAEPTDPRARGYAAALAVLQPDAPRLASSAESADSLGYELALAEGLLQLAEGEYTGALGSLAAAEDIDPLRAAPAHRARAYLAEVTGHPAQALELAEAAVDADPRDAYALYTRGRLLAAVGDSVGARQSFDAALEQDLEFEDALVALAEVVYREGRHADAERYLARAAALAPERGDVHGLRAVNLLELGRVEDARASFLAARDADPSDPVAAGGLAWVEYLAGDPDEALIQLANLDERRRDRDEKDPWRLWAAEQVARLSDHLEKVAWADSFDRRELRNDWFVDERVGPTVEIVDEFVRIGGMFDDAGRTRLYREYPAGIFVSFEADVRIASGGTARAGVFLSRERERRGDTEVLAEASLSRHKDGTLQTFFRRSGRSDFAYEDVTGIAFPTDRWVRLRIERQGDAIDTAVTLSIDGIPVAEAEPVTGLGHSTSTLRVGFFAEGEIGRRVELDLDDVEVVFRR